MFCYVHERISVTIEDAKTASRKIYELKKKFQNSVFGEAIVIYLFSFVH